MDTQGELLTGSVAPLDAMLLKGDADPATRAIMVAALVLDQAPDFQRLLDSFERASRATPRMRARISTSSWPTGQPRWLPDERFDVADHVRQVGAPSDLSLDAVLAMASASATTPFDPARPLWDATLVTGLSDGRAVVLLRAHHVIADGVRAIQMMAHLLDLDPAGFEADRPVLEQRRSSLRKASSLVVRTTSQAMVSQQARAQRLTDASLRVASRPIGTVSDAFTYTTSAVRTYQSRGATPSRLLRARSRARTFGVLEFDLDDLRRCAKANGATVNDVFLTGLLGGLRKYHEACGAETHDLPIAFPVNVAGRAESPDSGNHFSAAVIPGPSSESDPIARLRVVHDLVLSRRNEPGIDAPLRLASLLHQMPPRIAALGLWAYSRRVDLQASNVVGPDCTVYLAGSRVQRFYAFGPLPAVPIMAVLVSYEGVCTIGFTIDPAAVTDPKLLLQATSDSFDELLQQTSR